MIIDNLSDFNLMHTFECGQCFRWNVDNNGVYTGVADGKIIRAHEENKKIFIDGDDCFVTEYFDLSRSYAEIKQTLCDDAVLKTACEYGYGIRILRQQPWETLISFIISANNNIPRIKKIIEALCRGFGEKIEDDLYSFPSAKRLAAVTEEELGVIRSGYRAAYIIDAARKCAEGEISLDAIYAYDSASARTELKKIKGVGDKVADCILLFAYQKFDVFPKDVWIKRILNNLYHIDATCFDSFVSDKFGNFGGFAQQYLFFYGREFI